MNRVGIRYSMFKRSYFLYLLIQLITKDAFAHSCDSLRSSVFASDNKSLVPWMPWRKCVTEIPSHTLQEKIDVVRKSLEKFTCLIAEDAPQNDSSTPAQSETLKFPISHAIVKLEKTVNDIKQLSLLTATEVIALHLLKDALCNFTTKFNRIESSLRAKLSPGEIESFTKLQNELNNELTCIAKLTLEEQLLEYCVNEINLQNFHEAWNTLRRITKKAKIYHVVKKVYDEDKYNFDRVLEFAKSAEDAHESVEVYNTLYHEIIHAGNVEIWRVLNLIDHLGNEIIAKSQNFTASEKKEFEGLLCTLHKRLLELRISQKVLERDIPMAEKIRKLLTNERKIFGANSRCNSELEAVRRKLSPFIEAVIFEHPVFLKNEMNNEFLCVTGKTYIHRDGITYRQVFTRFWKPVPTGNTECKWKLKRFKDGNYAIINLLYDEVLFSDVQKFPRILNEDYSINGKYYENFSAIYPRNDYEIGGRYGKDENKRYVCTSPELYSNTVDSFWNLEFYENDIVKIKNIHYDEYLFSYNTKIYRNGQHCVFTSKAFEEDISSRKWKVLHCS